MNLGELIEMLGKCDPNHVVKWGFGRPHSWRGSYNELAFDPAKNVTIGSMLENARSALGETFTGWKGGEYVMDEHTPIHLDFDGNCMDNVEWIFLLRYMTGCDELGIVSDYPFDVEVDWNTADSGRKE